MNKIQETIDKVRKCKEHYVNLQKFEDATNWRDVERNLIRVNEGDDSLDTFLEQFKCSEYRNFDEIYKVIRPLANFLRKEKISKIERIYNE